MQIATGIIAPKNFFLINKEYLAVEGKVIDFSLYTVRPSDHAPIQLAPKGSNTSDLQHLVQNPRLSHFFIDKAETQQFQGFMTSSMTTLIKDDKIPLPQKSQVIYGCAKDIMRDVLDNPRSGESIKQATGMADNIIDLAMRNFDAIPTMLKLCSRDYYTFSHCVNVTIFAVGFSMMIDKSDESELRELATGCILHDVGKSEIDLQILNKPGKLNPYEFEQIKTHSEKGYHLMQGYLNKTALEVILHHHEQADGKGYPHGLKEHEIPDYVKIATIADVYDALTTVRPYSDARPPFTALALMKKQMTGHFAQEKFIDFIRFLGGQFEKPM